MLAERMGVFQVHHWDKTRKQKFVQSMSRVNGVSDYVGDSAKVLGQVQILYRWEGGSDDFLCWAHHPLQGLLVQGCAATVPE